MLQYIVKLKSTSNYFYEVENFMKSNLYLLLLIRWCVGVFFETIKEENYFEQYISLFVKSIFRQVNSLGFHEGQTKIIQKTDAKQILINLI